MATINPSQDYDIIHTLTYASSGGTGKIRLYRGSFSSFTDTVYYRAGTSGSWTSLSVSGTSTTFPITSTTMQIAHNWNKSGDSYVTPSFRDGTMTSIAISQKAALSGAVTNNFMYYYAYTCPNLTTLDVPDTSGVTSVGNYFMSSYAQYCANLTTLAAPDTSSLTSVGSYFLGYYANGCSDLTTLGVPDTSGLTTAGEYFMISYAGSCSSLTTLAAPDVSGLTSVSSNFLAFYAANCSNLTTLAIPDTSGLTSTPYNFMYNYTYNCTSLTQLILPSAGVFKTNNVSWNMPAERLGLLGGTTSSPTDTADWKALTVSGKTLHTNYIQDSALVIESTPPTTNNLQVWTGSEWKFGKVWDGTTWSEDAKVWDGSQWV